MNFKPKTKEELETMNLLPNGIYHFKVSKAIDKVSKSGNEMIELTLEVFDYEGGSRMLFDYLLEAMPQKLFGFCSATNMEDCYHQGSLNAHNCYDKTAYVELAIQKGKENPQGGNYPDKNVVKRYTTKPVAGSKPIESKKEDFMGFDDQIPF